MPGNNLLSMSEHCPAASRLNGIISRAVPPICGVLVVFNPARVIPGERLHLQINFHMRIVDDTCEPARWPVSSSAAPPFSPASRFPSSSTAGGLGWGLFICGDNHR